MITNKKGFGLTLDAIIALMFVILVMLAISAQRFTNLSDTTSTAFVNLHYLSEDVLDALNKEGILDNMSEEWTSGNRTLATEIATTNLDLLIPKSMGYRLTFDGVTVAENLRISEDNAVAKTNSMRLLAGFTENKTSLGSVSRAYLTGIQEKTSSVYAYFGGFVGQGNITKYLEVPSGVEITEAYLEMDAASTFNLYVNGQACENPHIPSGGYLSASLKEDLSSCNFNTGTNTLTLQFTGSDLEEQYIGGGFVRVTYNTSLTNETEETGVGTYEFPGIDGVINYYSSFHVPGDINSMSIHLEFFNNYTTFLRVGDVLVYNSSGSDAVQIVDLPDSYLQGKLNYNGISDKTVPIRMGTSNVSDVIEQGNADVIVITDLSGSMMDMVGNSTSPGTQRECDSPNLYDNDTRRVSLAKCLDKQFVDLILNRTGNRVGLVGFNDDASNYHSLSTDNNSLISEINSYPNNPSGGTCICCALNRAYDILNSESSPDKDKYIVVMSDGITGYCCGRTGWWWWARCDSEGTSTTGRYSDCSGSVWDCSGGQCDGAIENAIWSADRVYADYGAVINSVGFGPVDDCYNSNYTLKTIAESGSGTYCTSNDPSELEDCYVDFANTIVSASVRSQVLNVSGGATMSILYPSSYIAYNYTPSAPALGYGEVLLTYDTPRFDDNVTCEGAFYLPPSATAMDLKTTSYSSEHWTDYLSIRNSDATRTAFRLADYGSSYYVLGDPYVVNVPVDYVNSGENNTLYLVTGDAADNKTGCSLDNRAIISIKMSGSVGYGNVYATSEGCDWTIEFEDGEVYSSPIPATYNGSAQCSYTPGNLSSREDASADAFYRLLSALDLDSDGAVDIKFDVNQITFDLSGITGVRSLWGPAKMRLIVWF